MAKLLWFIIVFIFNCSKLAIAHEEDLENFLLSLRDCLERIDRDEFPGNINFLEHFRDRLEGYIRIIMAISLVISNLQVAIGPLIANLLHCLREILQDLRTQIEVCNDDEARVRTRRIPAQLDTSSRSRRRYIISAEQIEVLRNTGMQWKAVANCLSVSPKTLYRRRIEYSIADSYTVIT